MEATEPSGVHISAGRIHEFTLLDDGSLAYRIELREHKVPHNEGFSLFHSHPLACEQLLCSLETFKCFIRFKRDCL